ncbi:lactonase family protein [Salininema proteolyticum]|uniref:Lactonase family protein n=1 Tax=Salininema proteolyticum TaxID=1607685 RepID=A0ABV8TV00_9ACTN
MNSLLGNYTSEGGPGLALGDGDGLSSVLALPNPSWITPGPDGVHYALLEDEAGAAQAFRDSGRLEPVGRRRSSGGSHPCHGAIDPTGRYLVTANYGSGSVGVLPIGEDGSLGDPVCSLDVEGSGPDEDRQESAHPHHVLFAGGRVYVTDLGADAVHRLALAADGTLSHAGATKLPPGFGPRHSIVIGHQIYIAAELTHQIARFDLDPDTGELSDLRLLALPDSAERDYPSAIVPDAERGVLYVAVRGGDSVLVVDPETFTVVARRPAGGRWPRDAALAETGRLWVACQFGGVVTEVDMVGSDDPRVLWTVPGVSRVVPRQR